MGKWEEDEHNRGQGEGSRAGVGGGLFHELIWRHIESDEFNEGFENGKNNPSSDDDSSSSSESSGGCFLTTACISAAGLPDDCDELQTLRWFRDQILLSEPEWRAMVDEYYRIAPQIVIRINHQKTAPFLWNRVLESVREIAAMVKSQRYPEAVAAYRALVSWAGRVVT